jgi:hypothetical protein
MYLEDMMRQQDLLPGAIGRKTEVKGRNQPELRGRQPSNELAKIVTSDVQKVVKPAHFRRFL